MSGKADHAEEKFSCYNCAQTVFSLYAPELGLDEKTALRIASGFGGGMTCAETCGAVTGAYMVIGLKHGHSTSDPDEKAATKARIKEFNTEFLKAFRSLKCRELLDIDISTPKGAALAAKDGRYKSKCPEFIKTACKILDEKF